MDNEQTITYLKQQWDEALSTATPLSNKAFQHITKRYQRLGRHYHTLEHLTSCLHLLEEENLNQPEVILTIIGHDLLYNVKRKDNEERSGKHYAKILTILEQPTTTIQRIEDYIQATKHQQPPRNEQEATIMDVDMSILGQAWQIFQTYDKAILKEYSVFPYEKVLVGRKQFLEQLLRQPQLYYTDIFRKKFEEQAQTNIKRILQERYST